MILSYTFLLDRCFFVFIKRINTFESNLILDCIKVGVVNYIPKFLCVCHVRVPIPTMTFPMSTKSGGDISVDRQVGPADRHSKLSNRIDFLFNIANLSISTFKLRDSVV